MIRTALDTDGETHPSFAEVVHNVRTDHPEGLNQLHSVFRLLSASLRRQIGWRDFEDCEHDVFIAVAEAIHEGRLRESSALAGYIHGIARLLVCSKITANSMHHRLAGSLQHWASMRNGNHTPEDMFADRERSDLLQILLATLNVRDHEIVTRFYLDGQTKEQICNEMGLTLTQFRLYKSRAKQHLSRSALNC